MAKITANGAHKVTEARRERDATDIWPDAITTIEDVLVLCSDGRILRRTLYPLTQADRDYADKYERGRTFGRDSSGYKIVAKVKPDALGKAREVFEAYAAKRGYTLEV